MTYGSNYPWIVPGQGAVQTYHLNRSLAQSQLAQMRAAGLTDLRIPIEILDSTEYGAGDGFNVELMGYSFDSQRQQNLINLIADARAAGFTWICVGPGGAGEVLGASNWPSLGTRWFPMGNLIDWIHSLGVDMIDLGELIDPAYPVMLDYARTLWAYCTSQWGNAAVTIGLTPGPANIVAAPSVYKGPDQSGPVNWPSEIGLHVYGPAPFAGHGSAYSTICSMIQELQQQGLPTSTKLSIHEKYDNADLISNTEIQRAISDNPWQWQRVVQWPLMPDGSNSSPCVRGWKTID